jgi:hypothetical protein
MRPQVAAAMPKQNWLQKQLRAKPRIWALRLAAAIFVVAILAQHPASAGYFNDATNAFKGATAGWIDHSLDSADALFSLVMSAFIVVVIAKTGFQAIAGETVTLATVLYPLAEMLSFLIGPLVVMKIIARQALPQLVPAALTLTGMVAPGARATDPDSVFDVIMTFDNNFLAATFAPLNKALAASGGIINPLGIFTMHDLVLGGIEGLIGFVIYCLVLLAGAIVAIELIARYLEIYIVVSIGAIKLGLLASRATAPMAHGFQNQVIGAVFGLVTIFAFAALVSNFIAGWTITAAAADPTTFIRASGQIFAGAGAIIYATFRLGKAADKAGEGGAAFSGAGGDIIGGGMQAGLQTGVKAARMLR